MRAFGVRGKTRPWAAAQVRARWAAGWRLRWARPGRRLYGGGGGGAINTGGGGGSSFAVANATGVSSAASSRTGDGQVTISFDRATDSWPPEPAAGAAPAPAAAPAPVAAAPRFTG